LDNIFSGGCKYSSLPCGKPALSIVWVLNCEVMMGTNYPNKAVVRSSCNRILKGVGFKSPEQVQQAVEAVTERDRLERQKLKLKKIRRMIWGR
jgi:hypothetical protein